MNDFSRAAIKMVFAIGAESNEFEWVQVYPIGLVQPDDLVAKLKFFAAEESSELLVSPLTHTETVCECVGTARQRDRRDELGRVISQSRWKASRATTPPRRGI